MTHVKKAWESPSIQSLSVKSFTLSGCIASPNEGIDQGQTYHPTNAQPHPNCPPPGTAS
jgi:hypothetical protein